MIPKQVACACIYRDASGAEWGGVWGEGGGRERENVEVRMGTETSYVRVCTWVYVSMYDTTHIEFQTPRTSHVRHHTHGILAYRRVVTTARHLRIGHRTHADRPTGT